MPDSRWIGLRVSNNSVTAVGRRLVARIGGDEFVVLLAPADSAVARRVVARIGRAQQAWRVHEYGLTPQLSIGLAEVVAGDLETARAAADRSMYASKRRRAHALSQSGIRPGERSSRSYGAAALRRLSFTVPDTDRRGLAASPASP